MKDKTKNSNGYELPKTVAILYSEVKRKYFPTKEQYLTEKDARKDALLVAKYLKKLGVKVFLYPGSASVFEKLRIKRPEVVINLVDSVKGVESLSASIPGALELLDLAYTGATILGKSLDTNKFLVKKLLQQAGVPVPHYQLVDSVSYNLDPTLRFPLISKLNEIHGGVEINQDSVSEDPKHLSQRIKYLIKTYKQPVLIEEFIVGREITAILLEGLNKKVYLAEKIFKKKNQKYIFSTFEDQWLKHGEESFSYAKYDDPLLREYVKKAFDVVQMYDYGKFDIRMDQSGRYFFIDANCNPAFGPKEAEVALSSILDMYGVSFLEILKRLLLNTVRDFQGKERLPVPF